MRGCKKEEVEERKGQLIYLIQTIGHPPMLVQVAIPIKASTKYYYPQPRLLSRIFVDSVLIVVVRKVRGEMGPDAKTEIRGSDREQ